jgi:dihydrodipicolinate synthase/N-acetylneuraminate lyase
LLKVCFTFSLRQYTLVIFAVTAPSNGDPAEVDHRGLAATAAACIAAAVARLVVVSGAGRA